MRVWFGFLRDALRAWRAWRNGNRSAHRQAPAGTCCAAPARIYGRRRR